MRAMNAALHQRAPYGTMLAAHNHARSARILPVA